MPQAHSCDMGDLYQIQTLTESFVALSDEVQSLIDRNTILEHKLRYAHEQYQYLADKYAPAVTEVSETLAKLQLPPDLQYLPTTAASAVPLPKRSQAGSSRHQIALLIREGRRAAQQLATSIASESRNAGSWDAMEQSSGSPGEDVMTAASTVLEKDFTVQGKKSALACPFSAAPNQDGGPATGAERADGAQDPAEAPDPTSHNSGDPICAAMLDETAASSATAPSKCPIRFLDKHSPEEIARYVETHKHAIPRSHEVCVRRYQRNEEQIRKLDAKYGNLVSMVKDLSHLHRPMLPPSKEEQEDADEASNKRVEDWAQAVVSGDPELEDDPAVGEEREGRFDRPMRDIRVGESPSRPWGISVPVQADATEPRQPSPQRDSPAQGPPGPATAKKCPFDHSKMFQSTNKTVDTSKNPGNLPVTTTDETPTSDTRRPTFVNLPDVLAQSGGKDDRPPIVFNIRGPVFIGYPMEQAMDFMKQFQGQQ